MNYASNTPEGFDDFEEPEIFESPEPEELDGHEEFEVSERPYYNLDTEQTEYENE